MITTHSIRKTRLSALIGILIISAIGYVTGIASAVSAPYPLLSRAYCDLAQSDCTASNGESEMTASLSPHPIPVLDAVTVSVSTKGLSADALHVRVTGVEEDMGVIESRLLPVGSGVYRATFHLSVCTRRIMSWKMIVTPKNSNEAYLAEFQFTTLGQRPYVILE